MRNIELLVIGIRLVGIYAAFKGLQFIAIAYSSVQQTLSFAPEMDAASITGIYIAIVLLYFAFVVFLLVKPLSVAKILLPKTDANEPLMQASISALEVAAFTILGVYIITLALPQVLGDGSRLWQLTEAQNLYDHSTKNTYITNLCISVFQLLIGIYLCLQASGLRKLIYKIREFGHH